MLLRLYRVLPNPWIVIVFLGIVYSADIHAQGYQGIVVREVPIHPDTALIMMGQKNLSLPPRCFRVYACFDDPNWELQAVFGYDDGVNVFPWSMSCPTCPDPIHFYQSTTNNVPSTLSFLSSDIPPIFFPFFPGARYDSWWFIGPNAPIGTVDMINNPSLDPQIPFESGFDFLEDSNIGSVLSGLWIAPSAQGKADAEGKVLIAQLTTNGTFEGNLNFQFRRLNPDNTVYIPIQTSIVSGVYVTNDPNIYETDCPQLFLPLDLLSFDVAASDDRVNLMFNTLNEDQVESYTIERSMDMQTWTKVAQLPAKGGYNIEEEYFAVDYQPESGVNYYRLSETTVNGDSHALETRSVLFNRSKFEVYPNPSSDRVWFKGDVSDVRSIRFIDMTGKVVLDQVSGTEPIRELDVQHLSRGMYLIEFVYVNGDFYRTKLEIN